MLHEMFCLFDRPRYASSVAAAATDLCLVRTGTLLNIRVPNARLTVPGIIQNNSESSLLAWLLRVGTTFALVDGGSMLGRVTVQHRDDKELIATADEAHLPVAPHAGRGRRH